MELTENHFGNIIKFLILVIIMAPLAVLLIYKTIELIPIKHSRTLEDDYVDEIVSYMEDKYMNDTNYDFYQIDSIIEKDKYSMVYKDRKSSRCIKISYYFKNGQIKETPYIPLPHYKR
jgi:hypothetical protein